MDKLKLAIIVILTLFISGTARADADQSEVLWYNIATGELSAWLLTIGIPGQVTGAQKLSSSCDPACARDWKVVGTGNFTNNARYKRDVLWHNQSTGEVSAWVTDSNGKVTRTLKLSWSCDAASGCSRNWKVVGTGDFNRDGSTDVLWHNQSTGEVSAWLLDPGGTGIVRGVQKLSWSCDAASGCSRDWKVVGIGNFRGDWSGSSDVLWHNQSTGEVSAWLLDTGGAGIVRGVQKLSWSCDAASGCSRDWKPVGIWSEYIITLK